MIVAGIDPGKRGAVVVVDSQTSRAWYEKLAYDDAGLLTTRFGQKFRGVDKVLIENIHGRGGWGATQNFNMGYYFGQVMHELIKSQRPFELITPNTWTSLLHREIDLKGAAPKAKSLAAYHMYFPHDPIGKTKGKDGYHDGLIDALLIAAYELIKENEVIPRWIFCNEESFRCSAA